MSEFNQYNAKTQTHNSLEAVENLTVIDSGPWNTLQDTLTQLSTRDFENGCSWHPGYYSLGNRNTIFTVVTQQVSATISAQASGMYTTTVSLSPEVTGVAGMTPFAYQETITVVPHTTFSIRGSAVDMDPALSSLVVLGHACYEDHDLVRGRFSYGAYPGASGEITLWAKYWTPWSSRVEFPAGTYYWDIAFLVFTVAE